MHLGRDGRASANVPTGTETVIIEQQTPSGGCTCKGWAHWNKCTHYALWFVEVGMLEFLIRENKSACPHYDGTGFNPESHGHQVRGLESPAKEELLCASSIL